MLLFDRKGKCEVCKRPDRPLLVDDSKGRSICWTCAAAELLLLDRRGLAALTARATKAETPAD